MKFYLVLLLVAFTCLSGIPAFSQWEQTGGPINARVLHITSIDGVLFANGQNGGVFRSDDNGTTWSAINSGLPKYPNCVFLTHSGKRLYVSCDNAGIFYSDNFGGYWHSLSPQIATRTITHFVVHDNEIIAPSAEGGIYYSNDHGSTWFVFASSHQAEAWDRINGKLWVRSGNDLSSSVDNGKTLSTVLAGIQPTAWFSDGNNLYVGGYNTPNVVDWSRIFISKDQGATWTKIDPGANGTITGIYASGNEVILTSYSAIFRSTDGGNTFQSIEFDIPFTWLHDLMVKNGEIHVATDLGVFRSNDNGMNWVGSNAGMKNLLVDHIAYADGDLIATTSLQGVYFSSDQGNSWEQRNNGLNEGRWSSSANGICPVGNRILIGGWDGVYVTDDKGHAWTRVLSTDINEAIHSMAFDGERIMASTYKGCYLSENAGATWQFAAGNGTGPKDTHLMVSKIFGDTLFVATPGEIHRSVNSGASWTSTMLDNGSTFTDLCKHKGTLYLVGWGGLYTSTDFGSTWRIKTTSIKDVTELSANDTALFAGTADGLFFSTDGGNNWTPANQNLKMHLYGLVSDGEYFYAATRGFSVWRGKVETIGKVCQSQPVTFSIECDSLKLLTSVSGEIKWFRNGTPIAGTIEGTQLKATGTYWVEMSAACGFTTSNKLNIPELETIPGKPTLVQRCDEVKIMEPTGTLSYTWYLDGNVLPEDDAVHRSAKKGTYTVVASNSCGSVASDPLILEGDTEAVVYNIATPNQDGDNDNFTVSHALNGSRVILVNRWGESVYQTESYNNNWSPSELPVGVYFYHIVSECHGTLKGTLTVAK